MRRNLKAYLPEDDLPTRSWKVNRAVEAVCQQFVMAHHTTDEFLVSFDEGVAQGTPSSTRNPIW